MSTKKVTTRAACSRRQQLVHTMFAVLLISILLSALPSSCKGCFSIIVGKKASADGHVMIAHNEDDTAPQVVNHYKIARKEYSPKDILVLLNGGKLPQPRQTWAYIWSQMPGMLYSDSYVNEWGVTITSNNCPSREDKPVITDGGISLMLRGIVAQRAKTAREGVLLAGSLVERFGYLGSGRSYSICDPNEGWVFCVVAGKHWLARRVPDDCVVMIANTYTVGEADLSDKNNILSCKDIISYAVKRNWYNPKKDGRFNFAHAYARETAARHPSNIGRLWLGLNQISTKNIPAGPDLPFAVVPGKSSARWILCRYFVLIIPQKTGLIRRRAVLLCVKYAMGGHKRVLWHNLTVICRKTSVSHTGFACPAPLTHSMYLFM